MTISLGFTSKKKTKDIRPVLNDFPYLIMEAAPDSGGVHKFWIEGPGSRELFSFMPRDNKLSYAQPDEDLITFFLINSSSFDHDKEIKVNLDLSFNSKKLFDRLVEQLQLDSSSPNYFKLELEIDNQYEDLPTIKLTLLADIIAETEVEVEVEAEDSTIYIGGEAMPANKELV